MRRIMQEKKIPVIERTLVMAKPDGVQRGLVGEIIRRFEIRGLKLVALKLVKPTFEHLDNHYPKDEAWIARLGDKGFNTFKEHNIDPMDIMGTTNNLEAGKQVREWLIDYMTEAPVAAMVFEGIHAIDMARKITGVTLPANAEIGTIRGDFSVDSPAAANFQKRAIRNLVHASENKNEAEAEIRHWFSEEEIFDQYERVDQKGMY
jgi:nucleoside-diphosphate kinase